MPGAPIAKMSLTTGHRECRDEASPDLRNSLRMNRMSFLPCWLQRYLAQAQPLPHQLLWIWPRYCCILEAVWD